MTQTQYSKLVKNIKKEEIEVRLIYSPKSCFNIGNAFGNRSKSRSINKVWTILHLGIVTSNVDQSLSACPSDAFALIKYVPCLNQVCVAVAHTPDGNGPIYTSPDPSPQLMQMVILSPSGSVEQNP